MVKQRQQKRVYRGRKTKQAGGWTKRLPATVVADGGSVGCSETTAATAAATPTTTTTTATPAAATAATAVADHLGKTRVNLLLGLSEDGDEVTSLLSICGEEVRYRSGRNAKVDKHTLSSEEGDGGTLGTGTTSSTNTVDIVLRVVGVVVVQHMSDVANIFFTKVPLA